MNYKTIVVLFTFFWSQSLKAQSNLELGFFYTPPGIVGENWRKPIRYIPYTILSSELKGSYELGISMNFHFSDRWFLNTRISDYSADLYQYTTNDVAIFDIDQDVISSRTYAARCHNLNINTSINYALSKTDRFSVALLTGVIIRIPLISTYRVSTNYTISSTVTSDKQSEKHGFHPSLGGGLGLQFSYNLSPKLILGLATTVEYTRSILKRTVLWTPPENFMNHWQLAMYFPFSIHYNL